MRSTRVPAILSVLCAGLLATGCQPPTAASGSNAASAESARNVNPPTTVAGSTPVEDHRPLVVCFGDSLTAGYGTDAGEAYPEQMQRLLDGESYHYRVVNSGISGNTTKDGLERLPRIVARHPQIVVVEFGGNDGLRGLPLAQTQSNLAAIIEALQKSGAQVALAGITLPPDYGPAYIARFNAMYTQLARRYHVPLLPFLLQGVYGVAGSMQEDRTHATAQGNRQVAKNVAELVKPMLRR